MHSSIISLAARYLGPLLILLSLIVLYRGHNYPGGGFIGGLIGASAILLIALAQGWNILKRFRFLDPMVLMVAGLALAMASGLPSLIRGEAFMTGLWLPKLELPIIGKIKLGTPFLFDIGVYLAVIGFTLQCAHSLDTATQEDPKEER